VNATSRLCHSGHRCVYRLEHVGRFRCGTRKGGKDFFFEKEEAKNFPSRAAPIREGRSQFANVFCFFFSKKKGFLAALAPLL
jgi:hypothetical protein